MADVTSWQIRIQPFFEGVARHQADRILLSNRESSEPPVTAVEIPGLTVVHK